MVERSERSAMKGLRVPFEVGTVVWMVEIALAQRDDERPPM